MVNLDVLLGLFFQYVFYKIPSRNLYKIAFVMLLNLYGLLGSIKTSEIVKILILIIPGVYSCLYPSKNVYRFMFLCNIFWAIYIDYKKTFYLNCLLGSIVLLGFTKCKFENTMFDLYLYCTYSFWNCVFIYNYDDWTNKGLVFGLGLGSNLIPLFFTISHNKYYTTLRMIHLLLFIGVYIQC